MPDTDPADEIQNVDKLEVKPNDSLHEIESHRAKTSNSWYGGLSTKIIGFGILMIIACALSLFLSRLWYTHQTTSGFLGNLAAECLLIGLGLIGTALIARRKLDEIAPSIVEFIAQLRKDGTIKENGARKAVVCAVKLISDNSLSGMRSDLMSATNITCLVCTLPVNTTDRCPHCHLAKAIWDSEGLRKIDQGE